MLATLFGFLSAALFGCHIYEMRLQRTMMRVRNRKGTKVDEDWR